MKNQDRINKPHHYNTGKIEVWDFIEDQNLDYFLGNSVKYICRAKHKGNFDEDIKKAIAFLERSIRPGSSTSNRKP